MAKPVIARDDTVKDVKKNPTILDIPVDRFPLISSAGDMIHCAGKRDAQRANHKHTISVRRSDVKKIDLTLLSQ